MQIQIRYGTSKAIVYQEASKCRAAVELLMVDDPSFNEL